MPKFVHEILKHIEYLPTLSAVKTKFVGSLQCSERFQGNMYFNKQTSFESRNRFRVTIEKLV